MARGIWEWHHPHHAALSDIMGCCLHSMGTKSAVVLNGLSIISKMPGVNLAQNLTALDFERGKISGGPAN